MGPLKVARRAVAFAELEEIRREQAEHARDRDHDLSDGFET